MPLKKILMSPVGKKMGMALTGLILYGFLVGHLAGNLLLFKGDGGKSYNAYAEFLATHPLLLPAELGLLTAFILHIYLAISVSLENRRARSIRYQKTQQPVGGRTWASYTMIYSGIMVLVFVILHLKMFKYGDRGSGTLFDVVTGTFKLPVYAGWYLLAMILLGFHLWHAFQSAFQTLGLNGARFRLASIVLSLLLAGGFGSIPLWTFLN